MAPFDPNRKVNTELVGNSPDMQYMFPGQDYLSAWASPEAFFNHVEAIDVRKSWEDSGYEKGDWYGTADMPEAVKLARGGWKDGIERVERMRNRIMALHPVSKRPIKYDIVGSIPSVPRAVSGNPMNMVVVDSTKSNKRKVITLVSNIGANCGTDPNMLTNRGAVVAALVDHIEAAGFACEVITTGISKGGGWSSSNPNYYATTAIRVKEPHHPVDISRLSFTLGHAAMFRRFIFADWCANRKNESGLGRGLGRSYKLTRSEKQIEAGVYFIPSPEGQGGLFKDEATAVSEGLTFLINGLRKQGCPAFPKWELEPGGKNIEDPIDGVDED